MSQFKGSIAQDNVNFPIETVITPMAGENYSRAVIFMNVTNAASYLPGVEEPAAGDLVELNSSNYGTVTGGKLKNWLVPFFTKATTAKIGIAIFDTDTTSEVDDGNGGTETVTTPATAPIAAVYEAKKMYGYFKFAIEESAGYLSAQTALLALTMADELYSVLWVGTNDADVLTKSSSLVAALNGVGGKYRLIYNSNSDINGALAQLGATLSVANATGTPVGNSVDMVAFSTIQASAGVDEDGEHVNLSATEKSALDDQKIGYQTWVGDGTENVVTEGSLYSTGSSVGADWVKAYIEYNIRNTVDTSKIQKLARKAACNILVGFPSGRQHVPTLHKNENGEYRGYNGESVSEIEPIETAELAKMLHFGTATIPSRPFLEEGIERKKNELTEAMEQEARKAIDGGSANWNKVGTMAVGAVQELVRSDHYKTNVPNSKKTIEYKGSDKPLIDGADLINSLVFVVNGGEVQNSRGVMDSDTYNGTDFRSN